MNSKVGASPTMRARMRVVIPPMQASCSEWSQLVTLVDIVGRGF